MFHHPEDKLLQSGPIWHGVAIGWHNDISSFITFPASNHERLTGIKLSMYGKSILLVSFYAPTTGHDDAFLESVAFLVEYILQHCTVGDQVVNDTDSNCSSKSSNRRKESLKDFCEKFSLNLLNNRIPTFHHNNGTSESCIDFFLYTNSLKVNNFRQFCTLETPLNLSSHDPITASLTFRAMSETHESKYSSTYTDFNRERLAWDKTKVTLYQELAAKALSSASSYWDYPESIPLLCSLFSNLLVKCGKMVFNTSSPKKPSQLKSSDKILEAEQTLSRAFNKWKHAGKPHSSGNLLRKSYTSARSNLQRLKRNSENLENIQQNNSLMHFFSYDRNKVYSSMKKFRGEESNTITSILHTPVGTFHNDDVLEGFASDAENLGKPDENASWYDRSFYMLCKLDNMYIFDIEETEQI